MTIIHYSNKHIWHTKVFSILAFLTGSKIYLKEICGRGQFGIFGQSFLQRRSQDWKTTNGVGGNSLLRTIYWGQIRSKWTNLAAGWFLSPANQSQSSSLKKSCWKKTLPANSPLTYFCYRVKFCVKSYSMVGMIACEKKWSGSGLTVDQETKATFLATEFFRRKFFQRKYKNAVLGWNSLWVFDNLLASPRPPTWTNLRKMMRYWWTPSSPPPSAIWGFEVPDKLNDKNRKTKREYLFSCKQSF